jgi:hypothetical protein
VCPRPILDAITFAGTPSAGMMLAIVRRRLYWFTTGRPPVLQKPFTRSAQPVLIDRPPASVRETSDRQRIHALLELGWSHRRIAREAGVDRETVARYARAGLSTAANLIVSEKRLRPDLAGGP